MIKKCTLCLSTHVKELGLHPSTNRRFYLCETCDLKFTTDTLDSEQEKQRYLIHDNDVEDKGYTDFLNRLITPMKKFIDHNQHGLDYGSGPYPMLQMLMQRQGYQVDIYDPFFAPRELKSSYDYMSCTEVIEHFHKPSSEFVKIDSLIKPAGILAFMTYHYNEEKGFLDWWYINDPTHVSIYSDKCYQFIATKFGWKMIYREGNVVIFEK